MLCLKNQRPDSGARVLPSVPTASAKECRRGVIEVDDGRRESLEGRAIGDGTQLCSAILNSNRLLTRADDNLRTIDTSEGAVLLCVL